MKCVKKKQETTKPIFHESSYRQMNWRCQNLRQPKPTSEKPSLFKQVIYSHALDTIVRNIRRPGVLVEVENDRQHHPNRSYWVASVVEVKDLDFCLQYVGDRAGSQRFWKNLFSSTIHYVGWGAKNGQILYAPREISGLHPISKLLEMVKLECRYRTTLPSYLRQIMDEDDKRNAPEKDVDILLTALGGKYKWRIVKMKGRRVKIRLGREAMDRELWLDLETETIVPADNETDEDYPGKSFHTELTNLLAQARKNQLKLKLEFLNPYQDNISVGTILDLLPAGELLVEQDAAAPHTKSKFYFHVTSPCLFPFGFCSLNPNIFTNYSPPFKNYDPHTYLERANGIAAPLEHLHQMLEHPDYYIRVLVDDVKLNETRISHPPEDPILANGLRTVRVQYDGWRTLLQETLKSSPAALRAIGWRQWRGNDEIRPNCNYIEKDDTIQRNNNLILQQPRLPSNRLIAESFSNPKKNKSVDHTLLKFRKEILRESLLQT